MKPSKKIIYDLIIDYEENQNAETVINIVNLRIRKDKYIADIICDRGNDTTIRYDDSEYLKSNL